MKRKRHVTLSDETRAFLEELVSAGELTAKAFRRATALLELDRGQTYTAVAATLRVTIPTVSTWAAKFRTDGLQMLADKARSGRPVVIDGTERAQITALACSEPPTGYSQWSLRLLADQAVELGYCEHISHTSVRKILKKTN